MQQYLTMKQQQPSEKTEQDIKVNENKPMRYKDKHNSSPQV